MNTLLRSLVSPRLCLTIIAAWLMVTAARAADVSFYGVLKIQQFLQENPTAAVLAQDDSDSGQSPFNLQITVNMTSVGSVTNASVTVPGIGTLDVPANEPDTLRLKDGFNRFTDLDNTYPNGTYSLTIKTVNDGTKTINNLFLTNNAYPAVPWITNFAILQVITNTSKFTVRWSPWSGGTSNDFVQLSIKDDFDNEIYTSPDFGVTGHLTGQSNSVTVAASTLPDAGTTYHARLMFAHTTKVDSTSYSGVTGVAAYIKQTDFDIVTRGGTDDVPPSLDYAAPDYDEGGVPLNSVIAFKFTEQMSTAKSITWSGVTGANFTYTWNAATNVLYCKYSTSLPADTLIGWTLNSDTFADVAGNFLDGDYSGEFTTTSDSAPSKDVNQLYLYKGKSYTQTNDFAFSDGGFQFGYAADLTGFNTVTNLTISSRVLTNSLTLAADAGSNGNSLEGTASYGSQTDLDRFFVNTNYAVTVFAAHDGTKKVSLSITNDAYPNAPAITNFSALSSVDSSNNFTITWVKFTSGTTNDLIQLDLESDLGNTVYEASSLSGTNTSATIPAGTLYPGRTYHGSLRFIKIITLNTNTYTGVPMASVYTTFSDFDLTTAGTPIQASMTLTRPTNNVCTVTVKGELGQDYTLEATEALTTNTVWSSVAYQTLNDSDSFVFTDADGFPSRFYRVVEGLVSARPTASHRPPRKPAHIVLRP